MGNFESQDAKNTELPTSGALVRSAREAVSSSEGRYRQAIDSVQDYAIFMLDAEGRVASWSPAAERIKLYTPSQIIGKHFSVFYPPEDQASNKPRRALQTALAEGRSEDDGWRLRRNGTRFWANVVITPILDYRSNPRGELIGFTKITRDITDRKAAQDELKRAQARLETAVDERTRELEETRRRLELALEAASMGTWDWDLRSGKLYFSSILKRVFGYFADEFPNTFAGFACRVHPDDMARVNEAIERSIAERRDYEMEYRIIWPDGTTHWIGAKGRVVFDDDGLAIRMMGTAINIDDRKRSQAELEQLVAERTAQLESAQAALVQSAKLAALGEMAGGIAHEINTPLAAISVKAQQLVRRAARPEGVPGDVLGRESTAILETTRRIGTIISGLRSFAREGDSDPFVFVNTDRIVSNVLNLCATRFRDHGIELRYPVSPVEIVLECRLVPIEQVLLNLLGNAFDAVRNLEEKWVEIRVVDETEAVKFSVTDSGTGIPEKIAAKLTQPFFSTKGVGHGTGLGLSISRGIVEGHRGTFGYDAASPRTRFVFRLPKYQNDGSPRTAPSGPSHAEGRL